MYEFQNMLVRNVANSNLICALDGPKGLNNNSRGRSPWLIGPPPAFLREPRRGRGSRRIKSSVPPTPDFIRGYRNSVPPGQVQMENMVWYILAKLPISINCFHRECSTNLFDFSAPQCNLISSTSSALPTASFDHFITNVQL